MSEIFSFGSIALATVLLVACGSGNNGSSTAAAYGVNQDGIGPGGLCNAQVVQDWSSTVAPACGQAAGPGNGYCNQALQNFMSRDQSFLQGPGCSIPANGGQWNPGNQNGAYMQVSVQILQSYITQRGGIASYPNGQVPYYN